MEKDSPCGINKKLRRQLTCTMGHTTTMTSSGMRISLRKEGRVARSLSSGESLRGTNLIKVPGFLIKIMRIIMKKSINYNASFKVN
jgi:hypothetical protein